ncbi:hypothetical protein LSCM4_02628 [Leishmania orientalis]|uniref:Uncharacterized protein n=1 Tax=Leishmania orientalis TaxID=2249476 RepID=A0A836GP90_9TRYP|nr:hypothetical protein LSCM4_02628 [Leishmania orientalis]
MQQVSSTPSNNPAPAVIPAMAAGASVTAQGATTPFQLQQQGVSMAQGQQADQIPSDMLAGYLPANPWGPQSGERANYDANVNKATYAKRVRQGEELNSAPPDGVQRAEKPVLAAADPQRVNNNLPVDSPVLPRAMGEQSRCTFNIDRGSFAHDAYRNDFFHGGSFHCGMPGSMMMGRMGSMFGMGGPAGCMYGMGSMYGMNVSRPASLFGSVYGSHYGVAPMGSMYGMGGPMSRMGSMYSMGMPMRSVMGSIGVLGGPMGSMYSMHRGSHFGPNGFGSAYSGNFQNNMGDSQYNGTSNYGVLGVGCGYQPQSGNGLTGVNGEGKATGPNGVAAADAFSPSPLGQPAALCSEAASAAAPPQVAAEANQSRGAAPPAAKPVSGTEGKSSERRNGVACLLVMSAAANPSAPVLLASDPPTAMAAEEVLRTGPNAQATAIEIKRHPHCRGMYSSLTAGHNTALLLATDGTTESRSMATEVVRQVLAEALSETAKAAASHGELGYYDARVSACALRSATEAIDCVEGGAIKNLEIGSHPVFGPAFINAGTVTVRNLATQMPQVDAAIAAACGSSDAKVVVVEAVVKQTRPSQKGDSPTDVLLSSVLFLISNAATATQSFFEAFRNDANVLPALVKGCIGGACRTVAVLCLPSCVDPSTSTEAMASFKAMRNTSNLAPRSGNLARFITFAAGENDRLRKKPDVDAAVLDKVDAMLADGRCMLRDPRNTVPVAYPNSSQRTLSRALNTPQLSSRDINAHATEKGRDASNPIRVAVVASPQAGNKLPPTFSVGADGKSIVDSASGIMASALELVTRAPEDWRSTTYAQVSEVQTLFENGNNTAIVGTVSPNEVNILNKQPLWLAYKRMVSSLLSVATQKYKFAEVSLSVTLVGGNDVLADLLVGMDSVTPAAQTPQKLFVAYSPLFGPTVYKATIIKQPTPLQLESTINSALYHVPAILKQHPNKKTVIVASAVMKGVTATDVYTSSMLAASAMDPTVFIDILDKKPDVPHELFEYAFGGPCCTLFLADIIQGDTNVGKVVELMSRLNATQNRSVRTCSVKKFIAFAEESLKKADAKAKAAKSEAEKEMILRSKKSMEVFHAEYKTLIEDPEHHDPKTYRRSGGGTGSSGSGAAAAHSTTPSASKTRSRATPSTGGIPAGKCMSLADGDTGRGSERTKKADADSKSSGSRRSSGHRKASADGERRPHSRSKADADAKSSGSRRSSGHRKTSADGERRPHSRSKADADAKSSGSRRSSGHRKASADGERRSHSRSKADADAKSSGSRRSSGSKLSTSSSSHRHHQRLPKDTRK